jgi:hypothetical protein
MPGYNGMTVLKKLKTARDENRTPVHQRVRVADNSTLGVST